MSVTAARRVPGSGGRRRHQGQWWRRTWLWWSMTDRPDAAAGVFTRNQVKAAPVLWSAQVLTERRLRAVVLNSGGANACTGPGGFEDTHATAEQVADGAGCGAIEVAVCSTGLIGERLPTGRGCCPESTSGGRIGRDPGRAAWPPPPRCSPPTPSPSRPRSPATGWTVGGFAKGAGMIAPSLATMLCVLTTDAAVDEATLDRVLRVPRPETFDRLDIDGSCSHQRHRAAAGLRSLGGQRPTGRSSPRRCAGVCQELVSGLASRRRGCHQGDRDHRPRSGRREDDALAAARASPGQPASRPPFRVRPQLGTDRGRGRATTGHRVEPATLDVRINGVLLCRGGAVGGDRSTADLSGREITVEVDLHLGAGQATVLTTDLSHAYVEENSAYST